MVSDFKDKFAKARKIGWGIFSFIMMIGVAYVIIDYGYDYFENEDATSPYYKMTYTELWKPAIDVYSYKDLLRNIDWYSGKVIFVAGEVVSTQHDIDVITFCINGDDGYSGTCNNIFIDLTKNYNYLEGDKLNGFVLVNSLSKTFTTNIFTGNQQEGDMIPRATELVLKCSNC